MITAEAVAQYLGMSESDPMAETLHAVAVEAVKTYLRPTGFRRITSEAPDTLDHTIRMTARALYQHWQSPNGVVLFEGEGQPSYLRSDPLGGPVKALLGRFRGIGAVG